MRNTYLQDFFKKHDYPAEGAAALLDTWKQIEAHPRMAPLVLNMVEDYETGRLATIEDFRARMVQLRQGEETFGFSKEPTELLLFLLCTRHLAQLYRQYGLPESWFDGVARDLRSKLNECHTLRGIWGSFVPDWFLRFFSLARFVIGRLQYEMIPVPDSYCSDANAALRGQPSVNIHIPSGAPLRQDEVRASMAGAARFFADRFPDRKVLFICRSWLLFPGHREMLPEESGIRKFMEEFPVVDPYCDPTGHDLWRIFNTEDTADIDALPQNTSLQRAYRSWLKAGKPVGGALGIRYMQM